MCRWAHAGKIRGREAGRTGCTRHSSIGAVRCVGACMVACIDGVWWCGVCGWLEIKAERKEEGND